MREPREQHHFIQAPRSRSRHPSCSISCKYSCKWNDNRLRGYRNSCLPAAGAPPPRRGPGRASRMLQYLGAEEQDFRRALWEEPLVAAVSITTTIMARRVAVQRPPPQP